MLEKIPDQESVEVSKSDVVESLRSNPEDLSLLNKFLDKREAGVSDSRGSLALNVEVAEIYRDAGLLEAAKEAFIQTAEQALQEREDALYEELMSEADKI